MLWRSREPNLCTVNFAYSDVFVCLDMDNRHYWCAGCDYMAKRRHMVRHVQGHVARGDRVPATLIPALRGRQR